MSEAPSIYVQALALGLDPAWRRLAADERRADATSFSDLLGAPDEPPMRTFAYSSVLSMKK